MCKIFDYRTYRKILEILWIFCSHLIDGVPMEMRVLIEKQRLRVIDGFFSKSFFLYTVRKNLSWGTKYVYRGTFSFIFFSDLPWKRYSGIETGHVQFSNIFSHEKPRTFRLKKKFARGIIPILDTFENTKG